MAKRSGLRLARDITREVWAHPANAGQRPRAVLRAVAWQVRKRVDARPRDLPFHGGVLRAYPDSNSASNVVYFTETYDLDEMTFLKRFLRPGDVFVDGGANIGTYSLLAAGLVGGSGRVYAFEPMPAAYARLVENVELNGHSRVVPCRAALGAAPGTVSFTSDLDVSNRMLPAGAPGSRATEVPVVTLDEAVPEPAVRVLKLDLEGAEVMALDGARSLIAVTDAVLAEVTDHLLDRLGSSRDELVARLEAAGLQAYEYDAGGDRWSRPRWRNGVNVVALSAAGRADVEGLWGAGSLPR